MKVLRTAGNRNDTKQKDNRFDSSGFLFSDLSYCFAKINVFWIYVIFPNSFLFISLKFLLEVSYFPKIPVIEDVIIFMYALLLENF